MRIAEADLQDTISPRSKSLCILLAILGNMMLLGGLHRFYTQRWITGVMMFVTLGGFGIWTVIDVVTLASNRYKDAENRTVRIWLI
jgi:TM2 domain-containing membrane protein YozV